jgi:hypothetical protein
VNVPDEVYYHVRGQPAIATENDWENHVVNGSRLTEIKPIVQDPNDQAAFDGDLVALAQGQRPGAVLEVAQKVVGIRARVNDTGRSLLFSTPKWKDSDRPFNIQSALCYTLHKAQGATLTGPVVIDFNERPARFKALISHALFYVAVSRVKSPSQLFVLPPTLPIEDWADAFGKVVDLAPDPMTVWFVNEMKNKPSGQRLVRTERDIEGERRTRAAERTRQTRERNRRQAALVDAPAAAGNNHADEQAPAQPRAAPQPVRGRRREQQQQPPQQQHEQQEQEQPTRGRARGRGRGGARGRGNRRQRSQPNTPPRNEPHQPQPQDAAAARNAERRRPTDADPVLEELLADAPLPR